MAAPAGGSPALPSLQRSILIPIGRETQQTTHKAVGKYKKKIVIIIIIIIKERRRRRRRRKRRRRRRK